MPGPQTYKNHAKVVPLYHYGVFSLLMLNVFWATRAVMQAPGADTLIALGTSVALFLVAFYARAFAVRVQDRVIRLEMRLRLRELLPPVLHPRISEFTVPQLVALRFASDAELPGLAETVLRDRITDKKAIKLMIKNWTADDVRA